MDELFDFDLSERVDQGEEMESAHVHTMREAQDGDARHHSILTIFNFMITSYLAPSPRPAIIRPRLPPYAQYPNRIFFGCILETRQGRSTRYILFFISFFNKA